MNSFPRCKSRKRQQAKAMRQSNGLDIEVEAKKNMEHAIIEEARIPTTTTPTIKEEKAQTRGLKYYLSNPRGVNQVSKNYAILEQNLMQILNEFKTIINKSTKM